MQFWYLKAQKTNYKEFRALHFFLMLMDNSVPFSFYDGHTFDFEIRNDYVVTILTF